jgi:hypothetical protein
VPEFLTVAIQIPQRFLLSVVVYLKNSFLDPSDVLLQIGWPVGTKFLASPDMWVYFVSSVMKRLCEGGAERPSTRRVT